MSNISSEERLLAQLVQDLHLVWLILPNKASHAGSRHWSLSLNVNQKYALQCVGVFNGVVVWDIFEQIILLKIISFTRGLTINVANIR